MALQPSPLAVAVTPSRIPSTVLTWSDDADTRLPEAVTATGSFTASRGGLFVVTLTGEVDLTVEPVLLSLVGQFRAGRSAVATVDLRAVTFFDTAGLAFLSRLRRVALERGGSVTVVGASGVCLRVLTLVGFDTTFDLVP